MKIESTLPDHAIIVEAVMEGFVLAAFEMISRGIVPPFPHDTEVVYRLEPKGEEDWKLPDRAMRDGWADCEDLCFWHVAGLRYTGEDPGARCRVMSTGPGKLHAIVMRSDGSIDDPSFDLAMAERGERHAALVHQVQPQ